MVLTLLTLIHSDRGGVSVLEPRHAGELLPICSAPKRLQGGVQGLHRHAGLRTLLNTSNVTFIYPRYYFNVHACFVFVTV